MPLLAIAMLSRTPVAGTVDPVGVAVRGVLAGRRNVRRGIPDDDRRTAVGTRAGPAPGHLLVNSDANKFPATAQAAWCEAKSASGYAIDIVGPGGDRLSDDIFTSTTFIDLKDGPPALP